MTARWLVAAAVLASVLTGLFVFVVTILIIDSEERESEKLSAELVRQGWIRAQPEPVRFSPAGYVEPAR